MSKRNDSLSGLDLIRSQWGLLSWLAPRLGLTQQAITAWKRVDPERIPEIELLTGIPRHMLRPDLFVPPWKQHLAVIQHRSNGGN